MAKAAKRGPGRPRKTDTEDAEMTRPAKKAGRPAKDAKATKSTAKNAKAAKPAAAVRKPVTADVEEMSESDLRAAAEKWGIKNNAKLLKNKSALRRVMLGIEKVVNNANRDKAWAERQAKRAGVELKFGQGRPPNTDEGWKRKIYAMMADAGAFTG
ncbi:MAG TPA: hypothetical protein VH280_02600 [Verrucomicrobiae bacterium]|nr:hypothetical protein [Verrucomicrobiae bacterium]